MSRTPKSKGAAKEPIEPEAPTQIEDEVQAIEEMAEEARPLPPAPAPDIRAVDEIYVTIAPYSATYKKLAIEQHRNDPSLTRGAIILMGMQFDPGRNYRIEKTPEVDKLIKEGLLICMTGSFRFRVKDKPKAREAANHADN